MNYTTSAETASKMIELIRKDNDSPHYAIGYLESMIGYLCMRYPEVLEEVIGTIDYFESKEVK